MANIPTAATGQLADPLSLMEAMTDTPGSRLRRRLRSGKLPWFAMVILGVIVICAIFAPLIAPDNPLATNLPNALQPPNHAHWLGTDALGRDELSRLLYGARISLTVVIFGVAGAGLIGLIIGIVSGFIGGLVDAVLMRLTDAFMGLPTLLIALVFVMSVGAGLKTVIIALTVVGWAPFARIIRSEVLSVKEREFVSLARIAGVGQVRIMYVHILPNVFNTFVVIATLQMSQFVLTEASLSFLGAGVPPPTPSWGNMISDGLQYIQTAWWMSLVPGIALVAMVLAMNLLGDWLRDVLDPKLRQA
jgi:peptide/nickel transport system permease protein